MSTHSIQIQEGMKAFIQNLFAKFTEETKKMFSEQFSQQEERTNILESKKAMLQQQMISLEMAMCTSERNIEELEQYRRRVCLSLGSTEFQEHIVKVLRSSSDVFKGRENLIIRYYPS